jgi:predicted oxidoreductase (fatty acid repression mutant protein)
MNKENRNKPWKIIKEAGDYLVEYSAWATTLKTTCCIFVGFANIIYYLRKRWGKKVNKINSLKRYYSPMYAFFTSELD